LGDSRAEFYRHIDAANIDLKGFTGDFYHRVCLASLDPVLDTLHYLTHHTSVWVEITNLLIPGLNDSDAEPSAMTRWVAGQLGPDVPVHFTAFHPDFKMRDRPPTPTATLARARRIALDQGIRDAYTGNTHDTAGQSASCHHCGAPVIERDWYRLGGYETYQAACGNRQTVTPSPRPGPRPRHADYRDPVRLGRVPLPVYSPHRADASSVQVEMHTTASSHTACCRRRVPTAGSHRMYQTRRPLLLHSRNVSPPGLSQVPELAPSAGGQQW